MQTNRRDLMKLIAAGAVVGSSPAMFVREAAAANVRIAMVVKALGIGFFDACRDGGMEAAKELGNVDLIYTGPTKTTAEEQITVIDSLIAQKVDGICISANDQNALVPVCKKALDRGINPFLTTKSHVLPRAAKALADAGLRWTQVSIDTADPETADYLTGTPGYADHAIDTIRNLVTAGISVRINSIVTRHNVRQMPALAQLLLNLGVRLVHFTSVSVSMYQPNTEDLLPSFEECNWLTEQVSKYEAKYHVSFTRPPNPGKERPYSERSLCSAGVWGMIMHSDGKITLCDEMPLVPEMIIGDVSRQSLMEVWNSQRLLDLRYPRREEFAGTGSACYECEEFEACHRGRGRCFREAPRKKTQWPARRSPAVGRRRETRTACRWAP